MTIGTILLIILIIILLGGFSGFGGGRFYGTGYYGGGGARLDNRHPVDSGAAWQDLRFCWRASWKRRAGKFSANKKPLLRPAEHDRMPLLGDAIERASAA